MTTPAQPTLPTVSVPHGAWYDEVDLPLTFPTGWEIHRLAPDGADEIGESELARALATPIGAPTLTKLAEGKTSAAIAVDDLTRPTPAHRFLPRVLETLQRAGIARRRIKLIFGAAAHRPMDREEMIRKVGREVVEAFPPIMHDFLGEDVRFVGWVDGGPVYLNRHFLDADLRICMGGVIPHGEAGFGGGAKMVVPGLAGHRTIAHFHGALPAREGGELEAASGKRDRRAWAEAVARHIGIDWTICATINARRKLAGLFCGDVVATHRAAAAQARRIGRTVAPPGVLDRADVAVVNAYPLDTDPIQMGKSVSLVRKLGVHETVVINAASDGIFYHGMGMGSGVSFPRLLRNAPRFLVSPVRIGTWLRSLRQALGSWELAARTCYFTLNPLSHAAFRARAPQDVATATTCAATHQANPLVYSQRFPAWGFAKRYPHGRLFDRWDALRDELSRAHSQATVVVFPCAPLQWLDVEQH